MARRKITGLGDLIPFNPDMEADNNEGRNHEEVWSWEKECLPMKDHHYSSSSSFLGDDVQYPLHKNPLLQNPIFYSRITSIEEYEDVDLGDYYHDSSPNALDVKQKGICTSNSVKPSFHAFNIWTSSMDKGESSWSECVICGDDKPTGSMKNHLECGHCFCEECMRVYVAEKFQEIRIHDKVKCPMEKCNKHLRIQQLRQYIPDEVHDRMVDAQRESRVLANPTMMECPFLFCSGKLVDDQKGFKIKACPACWRIFCVECGVQWHMGKSCEQFQAELRAPANLILYRPTSTRSQTNFIFLLMNPAADQ